MMSIQEAYDPETRWGRAFGVVDRVNYSPPLYQHRGQDIRKLGPGGGYSVPTDVLSLSAGTVSHQYTAAATGREVVVDTGRERGRYEIHCHSAYFPGIGTVLPVGGVVTRNATADERPGTGWDAPHDHFVISDYPDAAHTPSRPVYDPRPFILSALASPSGDGSRPFEEDFMATMTDEEKTRLLTQLDQIHKELVKQDGAGWTRARIFATGDAIDKLVSTVDGIRKKIDDLWNYTRMKVDAIWKWALGKRASENVTGMPDDSPFRRTLDTPSQ